ncbi:glycosyltransferase family 87 protein [Nocardia higoensis]|uniref:glycosyltransferase family 87 protein n=1 Tax=Nocardia higoensis TaxID=228599 RepID=UPI0009FC0E0A|nr:glycosyltransferase 87 family protein [Nocardia higoensis]
MATGTAPSVLPAGRVSRRAVATAAVVLLCGLTLVLAYLNKARCAGPPFYDDGRSVAFDMVKDARVCYSDIQYLWLGRDIDNHVFPYIHGAITADGWLTGGTVEYPVLTGLLMWLGAVGAHDDAQFLWHSALLLAPFALLTAWLLARLAGRWALLWAAGPPLVLYAFHNWELPVVCAAVAAMYVVTALTRYSLRTRAILAAVLLGLGFCLKIYPGIFVLPLVLLVLTGGVGREESGQRRYDVRGALMTAGAAVATVVLVNLPFAIAGYEGWRASFSFQQARETDITTNSIWYWSHHLLVGRFAEMEQSWHDGVGLASPLLIVASFLGAAWIGWQRYAAGEVYPWIAVSAAMLCGFLVFHKVHSPQYTLWLIPFFVLLVVPWQVVVAYLLADMAIGIGVFRYFYLLGSGAPSEWAEAVVEFGVWGRASLLIWLFFLFAHAPTRWSRGTGARAEAIPAG